MRCAHTTHARCTRKTSILACAVLIGPKPSAFRPREDPVRIREAPPISGGACRRGASSSAIQVAERPSRLRNLLPMNPVARLVALASLASLPLAVGCSGTAKPTTTATAVNPAFVTAPAPLTGEIRCPITGEPVTTESPSAMYGVFPVYCLSLEDARQFSTLPPEKRASLAAAQVLPQKRIVNATCPLTGEPLTAAAAPVLYEGVIIGFASVADANQFGSMSAKKKSECIAAWQASGESGMRLADTAAVGTVAAK